MKNLLLLTILLVVNFSYSQTQQQVEVQKRNKDTREVCDSMKKELKTLKNEIDESRSRPSLDTNSKQYEIKQSEVYLKGSSDYLKLCGTR